MHDSNNIFNLDYEVLSWKVHRAIIRARAVQVSGE